MTKPSIMNVVMTVGLMEQLNTHRVPPSLLLKLVREEWEKQPETDSDGGNDKKFYSFEIMFGKNTETIFVVYTEAYSPETHQTAETQPEVYTIMLASEY